MAKKIENQNEVQGQPRKSLYSLANDFVELLELNEDGDIDEEEFETKLAKYTEQIGDKMDSWLKVAIELKTRGEGKVAYAKAASENVAKIKKDGEADVAHAQRMYNMVMTVMELQGIKKFNGETMTATIRNNTPSLEYDDVEDIPSEYLIQQEPKVDSKKLKDYLKELEKDGKSCDFARLRYGKCLIVK